LLTSSEKSSILRLSRKVLEMSIHDGRLKSQLDWAEPLYPGYPVSDNSPRGVFVTIMLGKDLRGCMGTLQPNLPLLQMIAKSSMLAAYSDPRFAPITVAELQELNIEISVLSPMQKVPSIEEIQPKIHGVYIKKESNSGVFLPQVWEQLPNKEDFLRELCISKAGLTLKDLKHLRTEISVFTVESFSETDCGLKP